MAIKERTEVTLENVTKLYVPAPGYVLLQKYEVADKWGNIIVTEDTVKRMQRYSGVSEILAISPYICESTHDQYLTSLYSVGDLVGFSVTTPIDAPIPEWFLFKKGLGKKALFTIHVADIIALYTEDEERKKC